VWSVRAAARAIFWIIQNFVVGLIVTLAKGVAWCTNDNNVLPPNNKQPHSGGSGTASLDEIEKIVNEREEEWKEKFESLWLERETEKDQELEEAKTDLKTRSKEIKKLKAALQDEKDEKARLSSLCEQAQKCREEDLARLKARMSKEVYCVTLGEAQKYLTFLNFIGEEFVKSDAIREQLEEQKIFVERIEQNPNYKRDCEPTKVFKVHCPNQPDYDNLRMDIQKTLAKLSKSGDPNPLDDESIPEALKNLIIQVQLEFPDLSDVEVYEKILRVKAENKGSLSGLNVHKIVKKIASSRNFDNARDGRSSSQSSSSSTSSVDSLGPHSCAICIEPFSTSSQRPYSLDGCRHTFHENCIKMWLAKKHECPICRKHQVWPLIQSLFHRFSLNSRHPKLKIFFKLKGFSLKI